MPRAEPETEGEGGRDLRGGEELGSGHRMWEGAREGTREGVREGCGRGREGSAGGGVGSSLLGHLGSRAGREGEGVAVSAPGGQAEGGKVQEGRRRVLRHSKDGVTGS